MTDRPNVTIGQHSTAGRKERNDDSYGVVVPDPPLLFTKGIAMAIADGMSSSEAAKEASETCVKSFLDDYFCTHESWTAKKSVATVLKAINIWLYKQGETQYLSNRGMVSTFSGLVLKAGLAHIFHAGDSRISLLRNGKIEPLTRDHRVRVSPRQEYLSRAMGIDLDVEIDYRSEPVAEDDILIFTTDGVHDNIEATKLATIVAAAGENLDAAAQAVVEAAYDNGSEDNLTCQLVRVADPGRPDEYSHLKRLTSLPFPPDLSAGEIFEGYRIIGELHASNRTQIYQAVDTETNQRVVIKTPSVNFEDDPAYIEMFTREEWVGRRAKGPNVVRVIEPLRPRRFLYYVTEFVEGDTLRTWIQKHPRPAVGDVCSIIAQIAAGLRAFHRKDMVHQDLKPENIVIEESGSVKIIDFGSSYVAGLEEIGGAEEPPAFAGTIGYTAPEYHLGHKPTNRFDIFSLGVIAYEMLTGKLPYTEGFANARSISRLEPVSANVLAPSMPAWVSGALAKATHKDPTKRYDALSAFVADLTRPNPDLERTAVLPLIERSPLAFWKWLAMLSLVANFALLLVIGSR